MKAMLDNTAFIYTFYADLSVTILQYDSWFVASIILWFMSVSGYNSVLQKYCPFELHIWFSECDILPCLWHREQLLAIISFYLLQTISSMLSKLIKTRFWVLLLVGSGFCHMAAFRYLSFFKMQPTSAQPNQAAHWRTWNDASTRDTSVNVTVII